jgi:hypothetical protein
MILQRRFVIRRHSYVRCLPAKFKPEGAHCMVFAWERGLYPGGMKPRESKQMSWALIQLHLFDVQLRDMVQEDILESTEWDILSH